MGQNSKIEWTTHTWNPWLGCTNVSLACDNCYAEDMMANRYGRVEWGAGADRKRTSAANWALPFRWDRIAQADGSRPTVFCLSLGDIWDNEVDPLWRWQALEVMEKTPHLTYLLLSKRIGNAVKMCDPLAGNRCLPPNAALGATMVTQDEWDRDEPKLRHAGEVLGAKFTFASVEPMLGPINACGQFPSWVIVGGESGKDARPMHPDWARSLRDQCAAAGVSFHFKQFGEWAPSAEIGMGKGETFVFPSGKYIKTFSGQVQTGTEMRRVGKKAAGRFLDGVEHNGFPKEIAR